MSLFWTKAVDDNTLFYDGCGCIGLGPFCVKEMRVRKANTNNFYPVNPNLPDWKGDRSNIYNYTSRAHAINASDSCLGNATNGGGVAEICQCCSQQCCSKYCCCLL